MSESRAVSRGLRRLLELRQLEEDQSRLALESGLAELHRLERACDAVAERARRGRQLVHIGIETGELIDRIAGLEEGRVALRQVALLKTRIIQSAQAAEVLRQNYQSARVERLQVETLLREAEAAEALAAGRRSQQALDDLYGRRRQLAVAADGRSSREEGT
jgi:flagellar biosynthesis chaperone FliJ